MRTSITQTIADNIDAFLADKSDDYKNKFYNKTERQQYAAINNWKRNAKNLGVATKDLAKVTASNIVAYLKDAHKKLQKMETLSPKDKQKIVSWLDNIKGSLDNFDRIKKQQLLEALQSEKVELAKKNDDLEKQISNLQNELAQ